MSDDAVTTTKLTTDEIISRLRAMPSATRLAAAERLEMLVAEQDAFISSINEAQDEIDDAQVEMERLAAERDALRAAIVRHRERVWGSGTVGHDEDEALYAVLAGRSDWAEDDTSKRDAKHG